MNSEKNKEEEILKAATNLFLEKGFKETSTTEIAKAVGCNQALVHYYFRTKDKLFDAIFSSKMKYFVSSLLKVSGEDLPFEEKLAKRVETHFEKISEDPRLPLFFFREINSNPFRIENLKENMSGLPQLILGQIQKEINEEYEKGNIRKTNIYDLLMSIASLNIMVFLMEPMFKAITNISDEDYKKLLQNRKKENVHIVLNSLKP